jgi:hypothetical protein
MTTDLKQLHTEMVDLCHEVDALQERALRRVEAVENDLQGVALPDDTKTNFLRLKTLITKV